MNTFDAEQEKEIFECYKAGIKRSIITKLYQITNHQFQQIVRTQIRKEDNKKDKI